MKIVVKADYAKERKKEYPLIEDQLDAIWKGGVNMEIMRNKIMEVKQKHPKRK